MMFEYFTLKNNQDIKIVLTHYGATVCNWYVPDRNGVLADIVLGFKSIDGYLQADNPYMGVICGRYAGRIANASFTIGDTKYELAQNIPNICHHGGKEGFNKKYWDVAEYEENKFVTFKLISEAGDQGFPGKLELLVKYTLTDDNELIIDYIATSDAPTHVNLTNHSYFNLSGGEEDTIYSHEMQVNGEAYLEVVGNYIPTGKYLKVHDTIYDFTSPKLIGDDIGKTERGYDECWVLNKTEMGELSFGASIYHQKSGRKISMFTTEPAVQIYTANWPESSLKFVKPVDNYSLHSAVCLEAQHFPNSPNVSNFPSTLLLPNEVYRQQTIYKVGVE